MRRSSAATSWRAAAFSTTDREPASASPTDPPVCRLRAIVLSGRAPPAAPAVRSLGPRISREARVKGHIRLRGIDGDFEGKVWESEAQLRAGRLSSLEVVLDDSSVSRRHAEVVLTAQGWRVRDLGSLNGTFLNG